MHRYESVVGESRESKTLLQALRDAYPTAPARQLQLALRRRDIKVNGLRRKADAPVKPGDLVEWFTMWQPEEIPVVYEDEHLLICSKPAGISTDAQRDGEYSAQAWAQERAQDAYRPRLVHRLDQLTSGLLVFAKDDEYEEALLSAFRERTLIKRYECIVGGHPESGACLHAYLLKDALRGTVRILNRPAAGAKAICTEYRLLKSEALGHRLLVTLHTGRTHQIRAHLAHEGLPILGDDKYGDRTLNKSTRTGRLLLAAVELRFGPEGPLGYLSEVALRIAAPF